MKLHKADSNTILIEPMKNRTNREMIRAYNTLITRLVNTGIMQKHHILDNECSEEFKNKTKSFKMAYQPVPPHDHHHNITEKASKCSKHTSSPYFAVQTLCYLSIYGADY